MKPRPLPDLTGRVALVTGAGRGVGRAIAAALAQQGAAVAVNDISPVNLDETVHLIQSNAGTVKPYVQDVSRKMSAQALIQLVEDDLGHIEILVNCAEVEPQKPVLEMDEWDWQRTLEVNLSAAFLLTQSVGRVMRSASGGVIIHVGERPRNAEFNSAYLASKAGLAAFAALAACELTEFGIRVYHYQPLEGRDPVAEILELCA